MEEELGDDARPVTPVLTGGIEVVRFFPCIHRPFVYNPAHADGSLTDESGE
jgi:hypothetical protein